MMLPPLPQHSHKLTHLAEWPGYAVSIDGRIWAYRNKTWSPLSSKWRRGKRVVMLTLRGSCAEMPLAELYKDTFGLPLPVNKHKRST